MRYNACMDDLRKSLRWFHFRLMLRQSAYAALWGLLLAVIIVIAAPWLRDTLGAPDYLATLALPLVLPAAYVAWIWLRRPDMGTIVQAADAWSGNTGAVVSAHELGRQHPDSPFVRPNVERAVALVRSAALPEPRPLRWALTALLVMVGLVPLSRWAHAQMQDQKHEEEKKEEARKTDVPPAEAGKLAKEAGAAAEKAKSAGATAQEKLADDIEQAARNAQAGSQDKERALREAHSLVDRARSQQDQQSARQDARDALKRSDAAGELAKAIENVDPKAVEAEARKLAEGLQNPEGGIDSAKARELRSAIEEARRNAPNDPALRRAAEALNQALSEQAQRNTRDSRNNLKKALEEQGKTAPEVDEALKRLNELDKQALARQLEELARQLSPLRDLDPSGKQMEELLKQIKDARISPEQAKELAEQARELSKRLQIDAETLRKMLQEGKKFEGLEEMAREMVKQAQEQGQPMQPGEVPDWVEGAMPKEWKDAARNGQPRQGSGQEGKDGGQGSSTQQGSGEGKEGGGTGGTGKTLRPVDGEANKEGLDSTDTGQGEKNPEGKEERLDPNKAKDETARRGTTGNEGTSQGVNTKEEEERLPRRYRETARKYFER